MSEYDWHPVVPLRWSVAGKLQQQFKRRVSNDRGVWYDEFEWRDVPRQSVDEIPVFPYRAPEALPAPEASILNAFERSPRRVQETQAAQSPPPRITGASARHDGDCPCWDCTRDQFGMRAETNR